MTVHDCVMADGEARGQAVRRARENRGLSRETLGRRADVSTSMVTRLEMQGKLPGPRALVRIGAVLGLTVEEIVADAGG